MTPVFIALTSLLLFFFTGTVTRSMMMIYNASYARRHWIHFGLGTCYEYSLSCLYSLIVYGFAMITPFIGSLVGFALVLFIIIYDFIDYRYFLQFQSHMPFSVKEYIEDAKAFKSSATGVIFSWHFLVMVLLLTALSWYLFFRAVPELTAHMESSWKLHLAWMGGIFISGLILNTIANSYVTKNIHDPLQFTPLQYLWKSKKLVLPEPAQLSEDLKQRLGIQNTEYPFLTYRKFGVKAPSPEFQELLQGINTSGQLPNIVFILLESFRANEIGIYGNTAGITPCFDALSKRGILFNRFYANSFQTRHALLASYCSVIPNYGASVMRFYPTIKLLGLPKVLKEKGYSTLWLHNADADFDRMRQFLHRHGVEKIVDEYDFPMLVQRLGWGISDEALMEKSVEELAKTQQPFWSSLLTISNHHPYEVPKEFRKHTHQGEYGRYLDAFNFTDYTLGKFLDLAQQRPFYENTIFFILADSSNVQPPQKKIETLTDMINLEHQIPLLIYAPWMTKGTVVEAPASQVDLPPSVMDLISGSGNFPWSGQSFLNPQTEPVSIVHKPGKYIGAVFPNTTAVFDSGKWRWEGEEPDPDRLKRIEDYILLNRWAIENDRFMP